MNFQKLVGCGLLLGMSVFAVACGDETPATKPDAGSNGIVDAGEDPCQVAVSAELVFSSSGITPKNLTIDAGVKIRVINGDTVTHQLASDPHPTHTGCPYINTQPLAASKCEVLTLTEVNDCGFHDHTRPQNNAFYGLISIQ